MQAHPLRRLISHSASIIIIERNVYGLFPQLVSASSQI